MDIQEEIKNRKLEMVRESQQLSEAQSRLTAQLRQVQAKIIELDTELKVLDRWEKKLAIPKEAE